jgi:archaellum component FlaC
MIIETRIKELKSELEELSLDHDKLISTIKQVEIRMVEIRSAIKELSSVYESMKDDCPKEASNNSDL